MKASVILPAHNEAEYIGTCLAALLRSDGPGFQIIVVANGCTDDTAAVARQFSAQAARQGCALVVIETPEGGKLNALNLGDKAASGEIRIYLDADVVVTAPLIAQIAAALDDSAPAYACGTPQISTARTRVTRAYARFWATLPFVTQGAPGFGVFAVNAAGRARWGAFPHIISDDTFVRLHFTPGERHRVAARYDWPMVEGFANLVRVRRRQNAGVDEIARKFPTLLENDETPRVTARGILRLMLRDPVGFGIYAAVALAVKSPLFSSTSPWARGR